MAVISLRGLARPVPPRDLLDGPERFIPAPDLAEWMLATFVAPDGPLANPEHEHLQQAEIGVLWTNIENTRQGRRIIGQCELGEPQGAMGKWAKGRARQQVAEWFGAVPDFIVTIDAAFAAEADDASFCALVEHELYHAAQEHDAYGAPKFRRDGSPVFTLRGHDVEEFVGVVRRYGAAAAGVAAFVEAASARPQVAAARISHACGTCQRRAA